MRHGEYYMHRIVTFKIDEELLALLDAYAKSKDMTRSEVIREAIIQLLKSEGYHISRVTSFKPNPRAPVIEIIV